MTGKDGGRDGGRRGRRWAEAREVCRREVLQADGRGRCRGRKRRRSCLDGMLHLWPCCCCEFEPSCKAEKCKPAQRERVRSRGSVQYAEGRALTCKSGSNGWEWRMRNSDFRRRGCWWCARVCSLLTIVWRNKKCLSNEAIISTFHTFNFDFRVRRQPSDERRSRPGCSDTSSSALQHPRDDQWGLHPTIDLHPTSVQ